MHAHINVGRTGSYLYVLAVGAAVYLAFREMCPFNGFTLGNNSDYDAVYLSGQVDKLLDLEAAAEKLLFELLGAYIYINIFFEPTERYFHILISLILELFQKTKVVLKQQTYVVNAVFEHSDPLYSYAERKTGVFIGVNAAVRENAAVNDPAAENFYPARVLAQTAALSSALEAAHVYLDARLREREVARAQTGLDIFAEDVLNELVEHTLKVA